MKAAVFFQKHGQNPFVSLLYKLYALFFLRSDTARCKYLRDAGASIGENIHIERVEQFGSEPCLITIGNNVYFSGAQTLLLTHDGGISWTYYMGVAPQRYDSFGRISIGNNCFIGTNSIILKGVSIGDNCIIGAGSIVTKDIPSGSVACGVPARVIETVDEYYRKSRYSLDDTIGWNLYKKRVYLEKQYTGQP